MNLIQEFENIINCPICDCTLSILDNGRPIIKKICGANNHDFILCRDFKVNIIQQINYIKTTEVSLMAMYFLHSNTTSYIIYLKNKTKTVSEEDYQRLYIYFKHNDPDKIKKVLMLL
mgnify:CR=1 FL=1